MSVSVSQQPQAYTPGYSSQWFTALSTQIAQPNFFYTVICTDIISGDTQTYQLPQRPDGYCVFDAGPFAENLLTQYAPINVYGWKLATGIRKIRVNIGETYGSTPAYASGTNIDYIVWNAITDFKDFPGFTYTDFVFNNLTANEVYLTNLLNENTYEDRSNYFYALTSQVGDLLNIQIETYDSQGTTIGSSYIENPYEASTDYREKYLCIDIGHKGLKNIHFSLVTGIFPIITDAVASYRVFIGTEIKLMAIACEPRYDVYTIHYLRKNGAFETINFSKRSDTSKDKTTTSYKKQPYVLTSGQYAYNAHDAVERVLSTLTTDKLKLNTDWLTEEEVELHADLMDAPIVYLDLGKDVDFLQLKVVTNSYKLNKRYNERMFSLSMDFEYTHQNARQRC